MDDNPEKLPMEHVERARLPWRDEVLTECGLRTVGHPVITREQWIDKVKKQGSQRAAFTTCMTCWTCANRAECTWEADPVGVIYRTTQDWKNKDQFADELRALQLLVEAHRDEFDATLESLGNVDDSLAARRIQRRRQAG